MSGWCFCYHTVLAGKFHEDFNFMLFVSSSQLAKIKCIHCCLLAAILGDRACVTVVSRALQIYSIHMLHCLRQRLKLACACILCHN